MAGALMLGLGAFSGTALASQLAIGSILVATPKSHDPDFARSVVVLIHYDSESAMGLMLNRPTDVPVTEALPDAKGKIVVYGGGPVAIGVRGLVRSNAAPYFSVIANKAELLRLISSRTDANSFRIYAGYAGWTSRELESEMSRGLWRVIAPSGSLSFDREPKTLWMRLNGL
jgi:putative transcriptional regulator